MRTKYIFKVAGVEVSTFTLYGDHDDDTKQVLWLMLNEALALSGVRDQGLAVEVLRVKVN